MELDPLPTGLKPDLCSHAARVMSFKPKKTLAKANRWPHPPSFSLTPEILASAGYFHDPAECEPDRTTCWMCGESMKGWTQGDDPWALHFKWSPSCQYARLALLEHQRDTQTPSWSDSPDHLWGSADEWFPRGKVLFDARLASFCGPNGPWKHEGKEGIPSRSELARAGFHFTPNMFKKGRKFDVDDTTSCCYCHRSVTEWEVGDDPVAVHKKKGPCVFFSAKLSPEPPQPTKPPPKASKKMAKKSRTTHSNSAASAIETSLDSCVEVDENSKPHARNKKPSSTAPTATKALPRRGLASSTKGNVATDESSAEPEPSESTRLKQTRATRKLASSVHAAPSSPEPPEPPASKPPVTLSKSMRLSRSTSKPPSTAPSNRSVASIPASKTRTRANSNASSTLEPSQGWNDLEPPQTDEEEPIIVAKKAPRQRKASKSTKPTVLSVPQNPSEDLPRLVRQVPRGPAKMSEDEEPLSVAEDLQPAQDPAAGKAISTHTRTKSKSKAPVIGSEAGPARHVKNLRPEGMNNSQSGISAQTIFAGFNPQAPQQYPGRLPVAGKPMNTSPGLRARSQDPQTEVFGAKEQSSLAAEAEADKMLDEYLNQSTVAIPPGWLPNPYNPSRPFPPLTAEEAKMPLSEYFPYRARQEEEAFLAWIQERRMKPWEEAVERGKKMIEEMIEVRKAQRNVGQKVRCKLEASSNGVRFKGRVKQHQ